MQFIACFNPTIIARIAKRFRIKYATDTIVDPTYFPFSVLVTLQFDYDKIALI